MALTMGRADLHLHTSFSDGWPSPRAVVDWVAREGSLDVVAVTDHDTIEGAVLAADYAGGWAGSPQVIVGEEVTSRDGHIVGLFLERPVPPGLSAAATVAAIHDQGGIAVAAHPFWRTRGQGGGRIDGVAWLGASLALDAIEVENGTPGFYLFNQMAHRLNAAAARAELGGSDAHILDAVGRAYTSFPGRTVNDLRDAIRTRRTRAHRLPYPAVALFRYVAWGLDHKRIPKPPAGAS